MRFAWKAEERYSEMDATNVVDFENAMVELGMLRGSIALARYATEDDLPRGEETSDVDTA